jgi:hypothetical protein
MSDSTMMDFKELMYSFEKAYSEYKKAEERLSVEQEGYQQIGREYMTTNPREANHELIEAQRALRDEAREKLDKKSAECENTFNNLVAVLQSLAKEGSLKSAIFTGMCAKARGIGTGRSMAGFCSLMIIFCIALCGWSAVKAQTAVVLVTAVMVVLFMVQRAFLKSRLNKSSEMLRDDVLQFVRGGLSGDVSRSRDDSDGAATSVSSRGNQRASAAELLRTRPYAQFEDLFRHSLQLKDSGALASALRARQKATELVRDIPALYCVGKHNEMILEYNHIGHGIEARKSALESLKFEQEFKDMARALFQMFRFDFYQESIEYMTSAVTSYDEAEYYFAKLRDQFPTDVNKRRYQELQDLKKKYGRWYSAHRAILNTFYSRVNAQLDKGRYAASLSIIDLILKNSEKPGYNLKYEEYVDLLDDMCALAMKLLLQKMELRPSGGRHRKDGNELGCILEKPILYLSEFYPECLPKDRALFGNHYKSFALAPWIEEVEGWKRLSALMG